MLASDIEVPTTIKADMDYDHIAHDVMHKNKENHMEQDISNQLEGVKPLTGEANIACSWVTINFWNCSPRSNIYELVSYGYEQAIP